MKYYHNRAAKLRDRSTRASNTLSPEHEAMRSFNDETWDSIFGQLASMSALSILGLQA